MHEREKISWTRVAVCVSKSRIVILGDGKGQLCINRVNVTEIRETGVVQTEKPFDSVHRGVAVYGFIELQGGMYLGLVTRVQEEGLIGLKHVVLSIQDIEWIPVSFGLTLCRNDARHISLVSSMFKTGDFYFCRSLDLASVDPRFSWNYQARSSLSRFSPEWSVDVIHGAFRCLRFSSAGRRFQFILIARRSRFFAGTRYLKRGINHNGHCANEVETEQILIQLGPPDIVCRFKQLRASVPLHWSQDPNTLLGKPDIVINNTDLGLDATRMHFENLLQRYGKPVMPVSLLHTRPGSSESVLGSEYRYALQSLKILGVSPVVEFDLKTASAESSEPSSPISQNSSSMYE
ncbi:hypothetical protein EBZ37_14595, partial [bacterium]|nr:hypothetical protein [bacterium]